MKFEWPRPCRYADLTRASVSGALQDLALIADGEPREFAATISAWRAVVPSTQISVFHTSRFSETVHVAIGTDTAITSIEVPSYDALNRTAQALAFRVWASCAPYDSYGTLIKNDFESKTCNIIRRNHGIYLAHDPAYGVVRWFDADGLRDRLRYRGVKLLLYRRVCRIVHGFAWLSSRFSAAGFKWRKV